MSKILVVDDLEDIALMIREMLSEEGHDVDTARTVFAAKNMLTRQHYDLLVTDILMTDESGLSLIEYATTLSAYQDGPLQIIAISGGGPTLSKEIALGAAAFKASRTLQKPFSKQALTETIDQLLPT